MITSTLIPDTESILLASLCEPEKKLFADFTKAQDELNYLSRTDKFIYGYRLGALIMMEVMQGKEEMFK